MRRARIGLHRNLVLLIVSHRSRNRLLPVQVGFCVPALDADVVAILGARCYVCSTRGVRANRIRGSLRSDGYWGQFEGCACASAITNPGSISAEGWSGRAGGAIACHARDLGQRGDRAARACFL